MGMKKMLSFLKKTKIISRILVILWLVFGAAGAGFNASDYIITYPVCGIFLLLPVAIIEFKTNPMLKRNTKSQDYLHYSDTLNEDNNDHIADEPVDCVVEKCTEKPWHKQNEIVAEKIDCLDISSIDGMDGHDFEYFCADILVKNGFYDVQVTRGSGDQGVDVLAMKDGVKYAVQCKNYSSHLGNKPVQEINAGRMFYNCHVGVVMTNSVFTPSAIELAKVTGVLLWDRNIVQEMMRK